MEKEMQKELSFSFYDEMEQRQIQEQPVVEAPDTTISIEDMQEYGYSWDGMLPLREVVATYIFDKEDTEIYCLYPDNTEGAVVSIEDIQVHAKTGGIFGIEKDTYKVLTQYRQDNKQKTKGKN